MLFVVTSANVRRPDALVAADPERPLLRLGLAVAPRSGPLTGVFWRMVVEHSLVRYVIALAPFPVAMLIWPELALPISQAPLLMIGIVLFVETSVLSVSSPDKRRRLIEPAEAERGLDLLRVRAQTVLSRLAAERRLADGALHLAIEQSAMARVAPLTLVSVQCREASPPVLALDPGEAAAVAAGLFDEAFGEAELHRINLAANIFQRSFAIDARSLSAHTRLAGIARGSPATR